METSGSIGNLAKALAAAQAEMGAAAMTSTNPFLKNRYADLGEVIKASRSALAKHGLAVVQPVASINAEISVTTLLIHESGEWISSTISLALTEERGKSMAQAAGSVITYLRRYGLASMVGVYADEDTDDAQPQPKTAKRDPHPAIDPPVVDRQPVQEAAHAAMTLAEARAIITNNGRRYGDMDVETLELMRDTISNRISGARKSPVTGEVLAEWNRKLTAIDMILASREDADDAARAEMYQGADD